jgi:ribonuclease P protein component
MSLQGTERFPKTARLRKRAEFLNLSRVGSKDQSANFVVISKSNEQDETRLGITVSGKVGNSVVRNRIKRQVRECFRRCRGALPRGVDFLVIARKGAAVLTGNAVADELEHVLTQRRNRHKS